MKLREVAEIVLICVVTFVVLFFGLCPFVADRAVKYDRTHRQDITTQNLVLPLAFVGCHSVGVMKETGITWRDVYEFGVTWVEASIVAGAVWSAYMRLFGHPRDFVQEDIEQAEYLVRHEKEKQERRMEKNRLREAA